MVTINELTQKLAVRESTLTLKVADCVILRNKIAEIKAQLKAAKASKPKTVRSTSTKKSTKSKPKAVKKS